MVFGLNFFDDACDEEGVEVVEDPVVADCDFLEMEIFVVGVESDVVVVFGEFVGVALDELYEMRVVVWFDTEGNDFVDG